MNPFVSFIIPTLNAEKTLSACLESVFSQRYPSDRLEVIVVDGYSVDTTREIAERFPITLVCNPLRIQEGPNGGKALGVRISRGSILCFLDSDNRIWPDTWLLSMVMPFTERQDVAIAEPSRLLDRTDPCINRYCSCYARETPSGDPFVLIRLSSDRKTVASTVAYDVYETLYSPPILANGSVVPRHLLQAVGGYDYDADVSYRIARLGQYRFAQVKTAGIFHSYVMSPAMLLKKAIGRARTFMIAGRPVREIYPDIAARESSVLLLFLEALCSLVPIDKVLFALRRFRASKDPAWIWYPLSSVIVTCTVVAMVVSNLKAFRSQLFQRPSGKCAYAKILLRIR